MSDARIKPKAVGRPGRVLLERWLVRGRMTQGEAAEQIGISRVKLNQYLNAEARPSLETAIRIEDATGIGIRTWLVEDPADDLRIRRGIPSQCSQAHPEPPHHRCVYDHGHSGEHKTGQGTWVTDRNSSSGTAQGLQRGVGDSEVNIITRSGQEPGGKQ